MKSSGMKNKKVIELKKKKLIIYFQVGVVACPVYIDYLITWLFCEMNDYQHSTMHLRILNEDRTDRTEGDVPLAQEQTLLVISVSAGFRPGCRPIQINWAVRLNANFLSS